MAGRRTKLTPVVQEQICACIRAGGWDYIAAESVGIDRARAICLQYAGRTSEYHASIMSAAAAYRRSGQPSAFADGIARAVSVGVTLSTSVLTYQPVLEEALAGLGDEQSLAACRLLAILAFGDSSSRGDEWANACRDMALSLGLDRGDWPWHLDRREQAQHANRGELETAVALGESLHAQLATRGSTASADAAAALARVGRWLWTNGEVERAATVSERLLAFCTERHLPGLRADGISTLAAVALNRNERADFEALRSEALRRNASIRVFVHDAVTRADVETALSLLTELERPGPEATFTMTLAAQVRILRLAAQREAALRVFRLCATSPRWDVSPIDARASGYCALQDEIFEFGDQELWEQAFRMIREQPWLRMASGGESMDAMCGALALRLGDLDAAEQHYTDGLEWAERPDVRFGLVEGRCLQGLADVAEARSDQALAMEYLDAAGAKFAEYGAKLYLDEVLAKKQILKA